MTRITVLFFLSLFGTALGAQEVVHEDAEDGLTDGWVVYVNNPSGASVSNIIDSASGSRVIEFAGARTSNGYRLGGISSTTGGWNDTSRFAVSWHMRSNEPVIFYIAANTTAGLRYFRYDSHPSDRGLIDDIYVHHSLGSNISDDTWRFVTRDLTADLADTEPGNTLLAVHGFLVRGNLRLDDVALSAPNSQTPANIPPLADAGPDRTVIVGQSVSLDGSASTDPDGSIVTYRWTRADGSNIGGNTSTISRPLAKVLIDSTSAS